MAAAFTILTCRQKVEKISLIWGSIGGAIGSSIGLSVISPHLTPATTKIIFASVWLSFAFALFLLNRQADRTTYDTIVLKGKKYIALLVLFGIIGGCLTGMVGSGIDICMFSVLTLYFRVSEKVATPTSVVLMGINSCAGVLWSLLVRTSEENSIKPDVVKYWLVCIPIVVIGAPLGSRVSAMLSRISLARAVYFLDVV